MSNEGSEDTFLSPINVGLVMG